MHFTADWYPLGLPVLTFSLGLRILLLESSDSETVASVWLIAVSVLELSFSFRLELEDFLLLPLEILLLCPDSSFRHRQAHILTTNIPTATGNLHLPGRGEGILYIGLCNIPILHKVSDRRIVITPSNRRSIRIIGCFLIFSNSF